MRSHSEKVELQHVNLWGGGYNLTHNMGHAIFPMRENNTLTTTSQRCCKSLIKWVNWKAVRRDGVPQDLTLVRV